MHTWTESPINEIWKHLKFISYKENCKNLLIGKIKSSRSLLYSPSDISLTWKVDEISMCIQQGIEYFEAANRVTINTSPLLIYYGMLSLAKALIVTNNKDIFIDDIKYHGLYTRPINDQLELFRKNKNDWLIENEFAVVNGGIFNVLNNTINPHRILETDSIIRVKDCISCVPEMKVLYEKFYQEHSNTYHMYSELKQARDDINKLEFSISMHDNQNENEEIFRCIPKLGNDFEQIDNLHTRFPYFRSKHNMKLEDIDYLINYQSLVGGRYFVSGLKYESDKLEKTIIIDQILIDYIVLFILGEQVRYHQDLWIKLVQGDHSGTLGLIEVYIDIVKRRYPNEVLNKLFGEEFSYGVPARLQ